MPKTIKSKDDFTNNKIVAFYIRNKEFHSFFFGLKFLFPNCLITTLLIQEEFWVFFLFQVLKNYYMNDER